MSTGREAVFLRDRVDVLKLRLLAVKSKQCATKKNKYHCPEVFLDAVADKLTTTADLFLDAELLSKFYYSVSPCHSPNVGDRHQDMLTNVDSFLVNSTHVWVVASLKKKSIVSPKKTQRSNVISMSCAARSCWSMY
jgi:hypothetical protein